MSKNNEITIFSESNDSPQNVSIATLIAVLTTLSNKTEEKPSRFCSRSENDLEIFCRQKHHLKKFQWACKTQFWRPYGKSLEKKPKTFPSKSENDEEDIFWRKNDSRYFPIDT